MRWQLTQKQNWKLWFAWYPVFLEDSLQYAWLERVWRAADTTSSDPMRWMYESNLGEKRELDPVRMVPTAREVKSVGGIMEVELHEPGTPGEVVDAFTNSKPVKEQRETAAAYTGAEQEGPAYNG